MDKESRGYKTSISSDDLRSELVDKVSLENVDTNTREVSVNLVDTLALNDLVKKINDFSVDEKDKRSEMLDKVSETRKDSFVKDKTLDVTDDNSFDNRSEIEDKFDDNEISSKHNFDNKKRMENVEIKLEDTLALDVVVTDLEIEKVNNDDRRMELVGMIEDNSKANVKVNNEDKTDINFDEVDDELKEEKIQENVENISLAMIIFVVVSCLVVGGIVGYMLYKIAMNNSNVLSSIIDILHILM